MNRAQPTGPPYASMAVAPGSATVAPDADEFVMMHANHGAGRQAALEQLMGDVDRPDGKAALISA